MLHLGQSYCNLIFCRPPFTREIEERRVNVIVNNGQVNAWTKNVTCLFGKHEKVEIQLQAFVQSTILIACGVTIYLQV